jgi:hypothetical protein
LQFIPEKTIPPTPETDPTSRYPYLFDGGLLLVWLLCLFALRPLVVNPGLTNGPDVLYHTYRTAEMARSWQHGIIFPRWAEGMYYGYGSPVFHYYASFTYYLGAALMLIAGVTALDALRWIIVLCVFMGAAGMYLFMRQQVSRLAGVLAALAFTYAPYMLFTEPYARGAYPELFALAFFPWVMLAFGRASRTGRGIDIVAAAALYGVLILSHNLMALTLTGVLVLWLGWNFAIRLVKDIRKRRREVEALRLAALEEEDEDDVLSIDNPLLSAYAPQHWLFTLMLRNGFARALLGVLMGIGWTAFFWLPVVLETTAVQLENVTGVAELSYQNHFVPLGDLLGFAPIMDNGAINGLLHVLRLGVAQWVLALMGIITALYFLARRRLVAMPHLPGDYIILKHGRQRWGWSGILIVGTTLAMIFLMLPQAQPIWESFRVLAYLQFPWRLLGPLAFTLAFLVGLNALWMLRLGRNAVALAIVCCVIAPVLLAFPMLNAPEWINREVDASSAGYLQAEIDKRQSGTTYTNEYRPKDVLNPPGYAPELIADYSDGYPINKAHPPAGVEAILIRNNPEYNEWRVTSDEDFTLEVYTFYWLGWIAEVDGQPVTITPSPEHGLITLPVPAGAHTVKVFLGTTPARTFSYALTAVSLVAALGVLALWRAPLITTRPEIAPLYPSQRAAIVVAGLILVGLAIPLLRDGAMWRNSSPGESPAQQPVTFALGDDQQYRLIGYDLNGETFRRGDTLHLMLYWFPAQPGGEVNFSTFVHVALPETPPIAQADKLHPGGRAIAEWWQQSNGYILDEYTIQLPADVAAGEYTIFVGFYTMELPAADGGSNGYRPPAFDGAGDTLGDSIPLVTLTIE